MSLAPEYINAIVAISSGLISAAGTLLAVRRKQRSDDKNASQSEMTLLIQANTQFRLEIKKDLEDAKKDLSGAKVEIQLAQARIKSLEDQLDRKDKTIAELSAKVLLLGSELRRFTNLPDLLSQ